MLLVQPWRGRAAFGAVSVSHVCNYMVLCIFLARLRSAPRRLRDEMREDGRGRIIPRLQAPQNADWTFLDWIEPQHPPPEACPLRNGNGKEDLIGFGFGWSDVQE